jgi:hypothetical protein
VAIGIAVVVACTTVTALYLAYLLWLSGGDLHGVLFAAIPISLVCLAHILVLGVPTFLFLRRIGRLTWAPLSLSGFVAGFVPIGLATLPYPGRYPGFSSGGNWHGRYVSFDENGVATLYGWLNFLEGCISFGLLGCVAAVTFWQTWAYLKTRAPHATDA